jgi:hypothetical protein
VKQTKINAVWPCAVVVALLWLLPSAQVASAQANVPIIHAVVGPSVEGIAFGLSPINKAVVLQTLAAHLSVFKRGPVVE